ncbi:MAG: protein kinase [Planctomycetota bacterium]|nr:protein kinase [Planctomycetota bacterium]
MSVDETSGQTPPPSPANSGPPPLPRKSALVQPAAAEPEAASVADLPAAERNQPAKIGSYVVRRRLGGGAMGEVWLAHDPDLQRDVAIKTLRAEHGKEPEYLKRFLREARAVAQLQHANTVTIYQVGAEGDVAYLVMELVEGGSLEKAVAPERPLEWREATRAIRDAAAGLAAAHEAGLVHRDIKPANLMRTKKGVTKVVDFGLARAKVVDTRLTQQGTLMGTPAYMAPEQWVGQEVDARCDLYALICTYYQLLTGHLPFDAPDLAALGYQHRYEPFPDPRTLVPNLSDAVCRILAQGSQKAPEQRYQSAADLVVDLEAVLATPAESLLFQAPWSELGGQVAVVVGGQPAPQPAADVFTVIADQAHARRTSSAVTARARRQRKSLIPPRFRGPRGWAIAAAGAATVLLLAVVIYVKTNHGTVKIELPDPAPEVNVKVDGRKIQIGGLKEPLELTVGEHELEVTSGEFKTVTKSFTVRRGTQVPIRFSLEPKADVASQPPGVKPDSPTAALPVSATPNVLIITGEEKFHDWRATTPLVVDMLQKDPRLRVRTVADSAFMVDAAIHQYEAIVLHTWSAFSVPSLGRSARENLRKYLESGKGIFLIHTACADWEDWPEYRQLVGRVWVAKVSRTDPRGPFRVTVANTEHPITRGLGSFDADDELYAGLVGDRPIEVLATSRSKVDGKDYPIAFTYQCGQGRVFQCLLGHDAKSMQMPGVGELYRRGCAWAAGLPPVPAPPPTAPPQASDNGKKPATPRPSVVAPAVEPLPPGWKEIVYDFSKPEQLDDFRKDSGNWRIENGELVGRGGDFWIILKTPLDGDITVCWQQTFFRDAKLAVDERSDIWGALTLVEELGGGQGYWPQTFIRRPTGPSIAWWAAIRLPDGRGATTLVSQTITEGVQPQFDQPQAFKVDLRYVDGKSRVTLNALGWTATNGRIDHIHPRYIRLGGIRCGMKFSNLRIRYKPAAPPTSAASSAGPPLAIAPFDAATARQHQAAWAKQLGVPVEVTNSIRMKLALIPSGERSPTTGT